MLLLDYFLGWSALLAGFCGCFILSPRGSKMATAAARPREPLLLTKKTIRLVVEDSMEMDAMSIVTALPDFCDEIVGVVP